MEGRFPNSGARRRPGALGPPDRFESGQIGAELEDGLRENPCWIAFARENGTVYHT